MATSSLLSKRRAYAAKFAGISFWTNAGLSYICLLYLKYFNDSLAQRIHTEVFNWLPWLFIEKYRVLEAFDGFSHISFIVATFFQCVLLFPMAALFAVMHSRASASERIDYFFPSLSNFLWFSIGVFVTIYAIYFDTLLYDATVKIVYFTIWPTFPVVSAIIGFVFQFYLVSSALTIFGQAKFGEPR